jgi:peptidoglycan/xylan/chitin deacetylase (PgdA/CDA1 family)
MTRSRENRCTSCRWLFCAVFWSFLAAVSARAAQPGPATPPTLPPLSRHPVVALTFDDLPAGGGLHQGYTRTGIATQLTRELRAAHLKSVYGFVNGVGVADDPDMQQALRVWIAAGMNIGNHTWSHPALSDQTAAEFEHNIAINEPLLRQYAGKRDWHWFRFPYLEEGATLEQRNDVRAWLHNHGYRIAEVTLNFNDDDWDDPFGRCLAKQDDASIAWLRQSYMQNAAEFIHLGRETEQLAFGHEIPAVLLLHETSFTTLMLPSLLHLLHQEGFRFASLPKVESNPVYSLNPNIGLPNGDSFPDAFLDAHRKAYPHFEPEPVQRLESICQ